MRVALGISYQGTPYCGWQIQPAVATVQARLERAIEQFALAEIGTICAGRTDTGVHAQTQVVHFDTEVLRDEFSWVRGVNAFLPADIRVTWARHMQGGNAGFHARNSAQRRRYRYLLYQAPVASAIASKRCGWTFLSLDDDKMLAASRHWLGTHDFSAFRSSECQALDPVKLMHRISMEAHGPWRVFSFEASAFLHHMVRNMMGTLVAIGAGKRPVTWAKELLDAADRRLGDPTFMPDGLYLDAVKYPEQYGLDELTWADNLYLL